MKKVYVVDDNDSFKSRIESVSNKRRVNVDFFASSMEVLPLIEKELPSLIFVNLELPDMNEFVMYDLLKKADMKPPIPVVVSYGETAGKNLDKYKKLKFKPEGYYKIPLSDEDIASFLEKYAGPPTAGKKKKNAPEPMEPASDTHVRTQMVEEGGVIFTEVLADLEPEPEPVKGKKGEKTRKMKLGVFSVTDESNDAEMVSQTGKELAERVISLEKQNRFLREENQGLSQEFEQLKTELDKQGGEKNDILSRLKKERDDLDDRVATLVSDLQRKEELLDRMQETSGADQARFGRVEAEKMRLEDDVKLLEKNNKNLTGEIDNLKNELERTAGQLTDKEREMVAKDHEFEKRINQETDRLIRETEDRLNSEFKETEDKLRETVEKLRVDVGRLENDRMRMEKAHQEELDRQLEQCKQLQAEIDQLNETAASLNESISALEQEKVSLSQELEAGKKKETALADERESLNQRLMLSEEDLTKTTRLKETVEQTLADTEKQLADLTKESDEQEVTIGKLTKELETVNYQISMYETKFDELRKLMEAAVSLVNRDLKTGDSV